MIDKRPGSFGTKIAMEISKEGSELYSPREDWKSTLVSSLKIVLSLLMFCKTDAEDINSKRNESMRTF